MMGSTKTVDVLAFSFRDLAALRQADPCNTNMFTRLGFGKLDEDEARRTLALIAEAVDKLAEGAA